MFEADRTTLVVRLRRESTDHRLRPLAGVPSPPRVVRDILRDPEVDSFDGPIRIQASYRELPAADVDGFVDMQLLARDRRLPLIAVAKTARPRAKYLDVQRLKQELAGFAHVLLIDGAALPRLADHLGSLSLDRGSARVWWPGLELDDDPSGHPAWYAPFDDPSAIADAIRQQVLAVSRDRWREPTRLTEFGRDFRRQREEAGRAAATRVVAELESLRSAASDARQHAEALSVAETRSKAAARAYEEKLLAMTHDVAQMQAERERLIASREDSEREWMEAEEQRTCLEQENRALRGRVEGLQAQLKKQSDVTGIAPETPEQAFERAIRESWIDRLEEGDRKTHPLVAFTVRESLIDSIARTGADRQKAVDAAMEVACGLAKAIEGRRLHRLRTSTGGNAAYRRRRADGATAWRCNIQTNASSARRLHYWVLLGGTIEFVSVALHDDITISD
jgi:hypothetical protein